MFYWAYPLTLCIGYVVFRIHEEVQARSTLKAPPRSAKVNNWLFYLNAAIFCFLAATVVISLENVSRNGFTTGYYSKDYISAMVAVGLFHITGLLPDPDSPYEPTRALSHVWLASIAFEALCLYGSRTQWTPSLAVILQIALAALRVAALSLSIILYTATRRLPKHAEGEAEHLISEENGTSYGTSPPKGGHTQARGDAQTTTWINYLLGFQRLFPFLWPSDSRALQMQACFCFLLLAVQRVINILAPHQLGVLVASLGPGKLPHKELLLYVLFRGLQGQQGVIGSIRALLWIPIGQSTYRRLSTATFEHVLNLSLDFHASKRIGEVTSALNKGSALNTFLDSFAFQLFPMVADLWIAAVYFFVLYDAFYSEMAIAVTGFYIFITIYMAKYRGRARRQMAQRERDMDASKTEALLSYETIHHSSAVPVEISRYDRLMSSFQDAEYNVLLSLNLLNAVQNGVFTLGTLLVCYLNAYQISVDLQNVAKFVTLLTYLAQLQAPLNFFGSFYTQVQNNLVDAERMLELFYEKPTVTDREGAVDVESCQGEVSFSGVSFSYHDHYPALHNISFRVAPGTSTAIVGESGSGKSTILKLLFRFYDVGQGKIMVDDKDVRDVRMESLRKHMGVVPQDTVLFNDTLLNNLLYIKPGATVEEVYKACQLASIHDKILEFPEGYLTVVGDRGVKLSGGERQRIAIARAILKSPRILLLDEATSSLDSETESQIQASLDQLSQGKTTITIAHRLSTITKADQILVLRKGSIVERGKHSELLAQNGLYAQMWRKQTDDLDSSRQ